MQKYKKLKKRTVENLTEQRRSKGHFEKLQKGSRGKPFLHKQQSKILNITNHRNNCEKAKIDKT